MEYILFFSIVFGMMINFTLGSIRYSGLNRSLQIMYKGVLEASVVTIDVQGNYRTPYFEKTKLKEYVSNYLENNITQFVNHYDASIYYMNKDNDTMCTKRYCDKVRMSLKADINYFFKFEKAKEFSIISKV